MLRKRPRKNARNPKCFSNHFFVPDHKSKELIPVCLQAFCDILGIKQGRIKGVTKRFAETGTSASERRGGDRKKFAFRSKLESVQKFIKKFKPLDSHYCRGRIKQRIYLDPSLNISKMYKMYEDQTMPGFSVTKSYFRKVFNTTFNIGFGTPRQDVCSDCLQFCEKLKRTPSSAEKETIRAQYLIHKTRAKCFFQLLKDENPEILILSFDCQKNLPMPRVPDQSTYYSRQLYIYNFTIVQGNSKCSLTRENVSSYVWTEDTALKGSNEISSCVYHCLNRLNMEGKKIVRLMADGCGGQNKNSTLIGMVCKWLHDTQYDISKVEIIFPVTGHSFIPPDRVFALTEKKIRRIENILNPDDYISLMSSNATIFRVVDEVPVFDWKEASRRVLKNTQSLHFQISKCKKIMIEKQSRKIVVRGELSYRNEIGQLLPITKRGKKISQILPERLQGTVAIKQEKRDDVNKLLIKHFGEQWRDISELKYFKNVLSAPNQDTENADNRESSVPDQHIPEEIFDFV